MTLTCPRLGRLVLLLSFGTGIAAWAQQDGVIWIEAESYKEATGEYVERIDETTHDYGSMAKASASGEAFVRFGPESTLVLPPLKVDQDAEWSVWVRAFLLDARRATVVIDEREVGTSGGGSMIALVWYRLGTVRLAAGEHTVELRAAAGNARPAYVDVVALLADPDAMPIGSDASAVVTGRVERVEEDFSAASVEDLADRWHITPPPGEDAVVEMLPREDDGALHVHSGTGQQYSLDSLQPINAEPGDQLTVILRVRKGSLLPIITVVIPGVGSYRPTLYRTFRTYEHTFIVPRSCQGPVLVKLIGRGGGESYFSHLEVFRPDPPVDPYETGRFLPAANLRREGRLFEIERYVVNPEAFSAEVDEDGDGLWALVRLSREENTPWFSCGTVLKSDSVKADRERPDQGCPPLHVRVGPLEPGRYQVYLNVPGRALAYATDGKQWTRHECSSAPSLGVITITEPYFEFWLDDRYAEPDNSGPTYADFIRFMPIEDPAYTMAPAGAPPPFAGGAELERVPLMVISPGDKPRTREPVRFGVPIPRGQLADAEHARLQDAEGNELPCFVQATGLWPDGSIKWLLVDAEATVAAGGSTGLTLEYGTSVQRKGVTPGLTVEREGTRLIVDTGAMRAEFDAARGGLFSFFRMGERRPALSLAEDELVAADGRSWVSSKQTETPVEVEEQTPFRVVVRLRGSYVGDDGPGPLVFDTRVHLFAGRAEALIEPCFIATEAEPTIALKHIRLRFAGPWARNVASFGLAEGASDPLAVAQGARLVQSGDNAYGSGGSFPFKLSDGQGRTVAEGERAAGWLKLEGENPVSFCLPHFWEQFPKALAYAGDEVTVDLWPDDEDMEPFVAHAGAGKSHRLGISLDAEADASRWLEPVCVTAGLEWLCASGAFEELVPRRAGHYENYEAIVDAAFENMLAQKAGYGMENWGDVWQGGYVRGARTWSNQEWDLVNNWVVPFARTGDPRFLSFAHEAARHFADVDCIHYAGNPRLIGASWMHAHTSLRGHQLEPPNFAHGGWVEGMLNVYHLTGDRRGLEAARGIAEYICRHAPQVESLPESGPAYRLAIQRPAGWPLTTLCLVYRETWEPVFLQTARRIVDYASRAQDPERGIWDAQVGHEPPYRGGCVFAYTLFRGLRLFVDITGERRPLEDYAKAARWMHAEMWRPGHRYLYEQCPLHEPGQMVPFIVCEMGGHASRLSGDPVHALIAYEALREHSAAGTESWMVDRGGYAQWGNGILTQVPRMLYDWEQTGLSVDDAVTLDGPAEPTRVPMSGRATVSFKLRNGSDRPLEKLTASCLIRGDWKAEVASCPQKLGPREEGEVEIKCQAPPALQQWELQSDLAHLHAMVTYEKGGQAGASWGWARLDISPPLEVVTPPSVPLKPGASAVLGATAVDGIDPHPTFEVTAHADVPGVTVAQAQVTASGERSVAIEVPVSAAADAKAASGDLMLEVRSGPRRVKVAVPLEVGRFRVAMIENDLGGEWRYPFEVLLRYPGIAPEFIPPAEVRDRLPSSASEIAERWEAIVIGDTGVGAEAFTAAQLRAIADFVLAGGGLMMIGGMRCYTPGGYAETPLAQVLPVDMTDGSYVMGEIGVEVTEPEAVFFEGYDAVFPLFGAHQMLRDKPDARVIARFSDGTPFATLDEVGKGRTLALGAIWNHGSGRQFRKWREYGRFIGRCVRWVARDLD